MSNRRKTRNPSYRAGYLRSPAWFARRDRWFTTHTTPDTPLTCAACGAAATKGELELHHADYTGVTQHHGRWVAREADEDLIPLHPYCHDLLHRLLDRDQVLARNRTRRDATHLALTTLHRKLTRHTTEGGEGV